MMRTVLFEAAQAMLTRTIKWSWLKAWGMKIARHRGIKRAVVAATRRIVVVMHRMWVDGTEREGIFTSAKRRFITTPGLLLFISRRSKVAYITPESPSALLATLASAPALTST